MTRIAIDAMGGDHAPHEIVAGAVWGAYEYGVAIEDLKTVASGRQRFVYMIMTVPGEWTVEYAHELADALEAAIDQALPNSRSMIHTEPRTLATA